MIFSSPDPGLILTIRFLPASTNLPPPEKVEEWSEWIRSQETDSVAEIRSKGPVFSEGATGLMFDVERAEKTNPKFLRRCVFFSWKSGLVRMEMAGLPGAVDASQAALGALLTSFRMQSTGSTNAVGAVESKPAVQAAP